MPVIRPVKVLEHDQQRPARRRVAQERRDGLQQPPPVILAVDSRVGLDVGQLFADLRDDPRDIAGAGSKFRPQAVRLATQHVGTEGFDEREIGQRVRSLLVAMSDKRPAALRRDVRGELLGQGCLADAGLAHHHEQRPIAGGRCIEGLLCLSQLRVPTDEGATVERARRYSDGRPCCALARCRRSRAGWISGGRRLLPVPVEDPQDQGLEPRRRLLGRLDQPECHRRRHDLGAALGAELALDVGDMHGGGLLADEERLADLAVGATRHDQSKNLDLSGAQRFTRRAAVQRPRRRDRYRVCHVLATGHSPLGVQR